MTERMAVPLTVYVEVPDDITIEQMDQRAESIRREVADTCDYDTALRDLPHLLMRDKANGGDA